MNEIVTQEQQSLAHAAGFVQAAPRNESLVSIEAEKAVAEIKSMMTIANMMPRNEVQCVERIMTSCQRPSLASVARYTYSRGGTEITGPTIRLVEAIAQNWMHMKWGWKELIRRRESSTCRAYAWDMQNNVYREQEFEVPHFRDTRKGRKKLTDDRDIYELCANMAARRMRACLENVIPGDVIEIAQQQCDKTLAQHENITPDSIKKLLGAFKAYGVIRAQIEKRLGRSIDSITPSQMVSLRRIYNGLKDGMGQVGDYFEEIEKPAEKEKPKKGTEALKDTIKKQAENTPVKQEDTPPKTEPKKEEKQPEEEGEYPIIEVSKDAAGHPMWTQYRNEMIQVLKSYESAGDLAGFQHANSDSLNQMKDAAPTLHQEVTKAFSDQLNGGSNE